MWYMMGTILKATVWMSFFGMVCESVERTKVKEAEAKGSVTHLTLSCCAETRWIYKRPLDLEVDPVL